MRAMPLILAAIVATAVAGHTQAYAQAPDRDRDGLSDKDEEILGTHPDQPDEFRVVIREGVEPEKRRKAKGYDPTKDFVTVEFCHAGEDRYLWRATFAEAPRPKDTVFHLYIDADSDSATGRKGSASAPSTGTDYMVTMATASARATCYTPDGGRAPNATAAYVVQGKTLTISADINLGRDDKGIRYALYVLCHTAVLKPPMSDSTGRIALSGLPVVDRKKIKRPSDYTESHGVEGTFGINVVRKMLKRKDVLVAPHDKLKMDGFEVDLFTYRRYAHVKILRRGGKVWTAAPKAGSYHVGFVMFDDSNDERVGIRVNDQLKGVAVANCDNNRWWVYWLKEPYVFRGGERVELVGLGSNGKHAICNILFLPKPLEVRRFRYEVQDMAFYTPIGRDGRATVSWTTTWPCTTRFEYGETAAYGKTAGEDKSMLVHRVVLEGLNPAAEYHGRVVGARKDGSPYYGHHVTFRAKAAPPPATIANAQTVPLTVRNPHDVPALGWPVTSGVPFPKGLLGDAAHVRLMHDGKEAPAQVSVTGRWLDGSVKWILLSFLANVPAQSQEEYVLEFGRDVRPRNPKGKLSVAETGDGVQLDTGALRVRVDRQGQLVLRSGKACSTVMVDAKGKAYSTRAAEAELTIEEAGPVRVVVKTVANLTAENGDKSFRIEKRIVAYEGAAYLSVFHTFIVDRPDTFTEIDELRYDIPVPPKAAAWQVALAEGDPLRIDASRPLVRQRFDGEYVTTSAGRETPAKGRIVGSIVSPGPDGCAVAVRDAWQNYPKGFSLGDATLHVGLCPNFEAGLYDKFPFEKEGHHLYYYLLNGHYKLKQGVAKTHEMFLCFAPEAQREGLCRLFQRRPIATAPPKWYCDSRAFYDVAPRDTSRFKAYEEAIDANLKRYAEQRERQHDYGLMNFGDWYGERGTNWGNIEYDTQHAFLLEYIRSGNTDAFFLAEDTEWHNRDIDTVQWSSDPMTVGAVYVHQMCHVGGYYDKPVPGALGFPRGGYTVSHAWTEGHFNHYFLTGDRRSYDTGKAVADFFAHKELGRPYYFLSCRAPGWHLIMNAMAYAATSDPYYLNASRVVVRRVLQTQDVEPRPLPEYQREEGRTHQVGGWSHMMLPGHCHCEPRHQGNAGFMVAVLLSGLKYFHDVTGDPEVKQCIIRGANYLLDETYSEEVKGFRYTSCPNTRHSAGASPLMVEGVARAYRWTRDERLKRVLTEAQALRARGSGYGKGFSFHYRCAPRVLADMAECGLTLNEIPKQAIVPFKKPDWMAKLGPQDLVVIQAEDFTGQGGGSCQIRDDRQATWGKMITYWHQDIGHWLEWQFNAPKDGLYAVCFRYATSSPETTREFRMDGKVPLPSARAIRFVRTGGFGNTARDWRYRSLADNAGKEAALPLNKGKHRIRMTNLKDGLGMDFIAVVKVERK